MIKKPIAVAVVVAALILAAAAGLRYAETAGAIDEEAGRRTMQVIIGLLLAGYANFMPKQIGSLRGSPDAYRLSQATLRFGGWCLTVAGLAHAAFWAFAPLSIAKLGSVTVVAAALVLTAGYALRSHAACRRGRRAPSAG